MEAAQMALSSHPGIDPSEQYDGPDPNVAQFPPRNAPSFTPITTDEDRDARKRKDYVAMLAATVDVLAARLLALIAVVGALVMFIWAAYSPIEWRVYVSVCYAVFVLWPMVILHYRKG
jgi:hypothetical protein